MQTVTGIGSTSKPKVTNTVSLSSLLNNFSLLDSRFYIEFGVGLPFKYLAYKVLPRSLVELLFDAAPFLIPLYEAGTLSDAENTFLYGGFGVPGAVDNLPVNLPGPPGAGVDMGGGVYWVPDWQ
jgi:hypothetical protein